MAEAGEEKAKQRKYTPADDARRRADGEAFDERMKEFAGAATRTVRSDQERRRRR